MKTGWWNDSVQLGSSSDTEPEAQFDIRQYFEAKAAESEGSGVSRHWSAGYRSAVRTVEGVALHAASNSTLFS